MLGDDSVFGGFAVLPNSPYPANVTSGMLNVASKYQDGQKTIQLEREKQLIYRIVDIWKNEGPGTCIYIEDSTPRLIFNKSDCNLICVEQKEMQVTRVSMSSNFSNKKDGDYYSKKNHFKACPFKFPCPCNQNMDKVYSWFHSEDKGVIMLIYKDANGKAGDLFSQSSYKTDFIQDWQFYCQCGDEERWIGISDIGALFLAMGKGAQAMQEAGTPSGELAQVAVAFASRYDHDAFKSKRLQKAIRS